MSCFPGSSLVRVALPRAYLQHLTRFPSEWRPVLLFFLVSFATGNSRKESGQTASRQWIIATGGVQEEKEQREPTKTKQNKTKQNKKDRWKSSTVDKWPSLSPTVHVNRRLAERRKETEWFLRQQLGSTHKNAEIYGQRCVQANTINGTYLTM